VKQICAHGGTVNFNKKNAVVKINRKTIMVAEMVSNNLYRVVLSVPHADVTKLVLMNGTKDWDTYPKAT